MNQNQTLSPQFAPHFARSAPPPASPLRVLLVDDEKEMREALALGLQVLGLDVVTAANGAEALDRIANDTSIAVLLTDLRMPTIDGLELLRRAMAVRGPELAVEALLMSGNVNFEHDVQGSLGGPAEFLAKPFSLKDAVSAIKRAMGRAQARREQAPAPP